MWPIVVFTFISIYCPESSLTELILKISIHKYVIYIWIRTVITISDQASSWRPNLQVEVLVDRYFQYEFSETRFMAIYVEMSMLFHEYYATSSKSLLGSNRSQKWSFNNLYYTNRFAFSILMVVFLRRKVYNYSNFHDYCIAADTPIKIGAKWSRGSRPVMTKRTLKYALSKARCKNRHWFSSMMRQRTAPNDSALLISWPVQIVPGFRSKFDWNSQILRGVRGTRIWHRFHKVWQKTQYRSSEPARLVSDGSTTHSKICFLNIRLKFIRKFDSGDDRQTIMLTFM